MNKSCGQGVGENVCVRAPVCGGRQGVGRGQGVRGRQGVFLAGSSQESGSGQGVGRYGTQELPDSLSLHKSGTSRTIGALSGACSKITDGENDFAI